MHVACSSGSEELVSFLHSKGYSLASSAYDGSTPLHVAVRMGQDQIVRWLILHGVNVSKTDFGGLTPAHVAAMMLKRKTALEILVEAGAKLNVTNSRGDTILHLAGRRGDPELVSFLIEYGAKLECAACEKGKSCDGIDSKMQEHIRQELLRYKNQKKEIQQKQELQRKTRKEEEKKRKDEEDRKKKDDKKRLEDEAKKKGSRGSAPGSSPISKS